MTPTRKSPSLALPQDLNASAAYIAFFLSGASSLIFQTIWTRMLHHVFGATSVAISTVLTVFMAGLGLGAFLGGKYAHKIKHPIIAYAVAEIGVGVWGLLIPLLVRPDGWLATVNAFLRAELGAESGMFMIARFLCVAPILIVPTTLMGSTLPLLTRHFVAANKGAREASARVGVLYAVNTFGAASGPLLSAFVLLPNLGLAVTNIIACSMNLSLALLIWVSRRSLLGGAWKPGQRLEFWPGTADADEGDGAKTLDAKPDGPREKEDEERDDKKGEATVSSEELELGHLASLFVAKNKLVAAAKRLRWKTKAKRKQVGSTPEDELPIPELARKFAFIAFAASGAAALCYEVVWSRALAMTIGSSIYSFALILVTFLIGIAGGAAAMSSLLGEKARPYLGLALTSIALVVLANVPWAVDIVNPVDQQDRSEGSVGSFLILCALYSFPILMALVFVGLRLTKRQTRSKLGVDSIAVWRPLIVILMAGIPAIAAGVNTMKFPGHLPKIILSVVAAIGLFMVVAALLSRAPILLIALIQLFIAGATVVSYIWQDEIPYAFAQLVVSIPSDELPDHVGTVKLFMWITVVLCTLPSTLGMGAMFPLTVRIWTSGGKKIAEDVAAVYTGNTLGSIIGAWLPGFILFALIGAEATLHLGIALNMGIALVLLIVGAADPNEDQTWWTWRRLGAVAIPLVAGAAAALSAWGVTLDNMGFWVWLRIGCVPGFAVLAMFEYRWLKHLSNGKPVTQELAIGAAVIPLIATVVLAFLLTDPADHVEWANQALFGALRLLIVVVGAVAAWANYRDWADVRPAPAEGSAA